MEGGGTEQKTNLLQFEELRLPRVLSSFVLRPGPVIGTPERIVSISERFQAR